MGLAELDRAGVARGQRLVLAQRSTVPDGADSVNDMPRRQPIGFGDFGAAGFTALQPTAFDGELGPGGTMDRTINATPAEERRISRVDDGVNAQGRDVGDDDFQPRRT